MHLSDNRRRAFTLVELMISLAIALVLILGIEQVFSITSKTIGGGQALSTAARDDRALHTILSADFQNAVTTSDFPFFVIRSGRTFAFNTAADKASAMDPTNPQLDPAYANYPTPNNIPITDYNYRNHRIDRLGFCERGIFQRQTGGNDTSSTPSAVVAQQFLSPTTSSEAFVWLGHLALPNNAYVAWQATNPAAGTSPPSGASMYEPGDRVAANSNNQYATDWILGRSCQLLVAAQSTDNSYIDIVTGSSRGLTPLTAASQSVDTFSKLFDSRYDQVRTSIADFDGALQAYTTPGTLHYTAVNSAGAANPNDWYEQIFGGPMALATTPFATNRFGANPFVSKPLTNSRLAKVAPIFVRSCTQFIVEYAGDFVAQDSTGAIDNTKAPGGDGIIDYQVVGGQRQIRWYGFPRHTSGNTSNSITVANDVVPLAAFLSTASPTRTAATFERFYPLAFATAGAVDYAAGTNTPANGEYLAAWGNTDTVEPLPKMIRITIGIDDPNGNLNNAQMYEYIFNLGQ